MSETRPGIGEELERERPHIAIAGASGRLGQRLQILLGDRYQISPLQHTHNIEKNQNGQEVIEEFDITDQDNVQKTVERLAANGVQVVINSTGIVNVDASEEERLILPDGLTQKVNEDGAESLALACGELCIHLIHLSTEYVFNGDKPFGEKYTENDVPDYGVLSNPTYYGLTKAWAESELEEIQRENLFFDFNPIILRLSQVQTPTSGLFAATLQDLEKGEPFTRVDNQLAAPITDVTAAEAIAKIVDRLLMQKDEPLQPIYHIGAKDALTPYEIALMVAYVYGQSDKARELLRPTTLEELVAKGIQKVVRPKNPILDVTRFEAEFGPLPSIGEEIERFFQLYPNF